MPQDTLPPQDLDAIEARYKASSPGRWYWWTSNSWQRLSSERADGRTKDGGVLCPTVQRSDGHPDCDIRQEDMDFIAGAHQDIPALLAYCRTLEAELSDTRLKNTGLKITVTKLEAERDGLRASLRTAQVSEEGYAWAWKGMREQLERTQRELREARIEADGVREQANADAERHRGLMVESQLIDHLRRRARDAASAEARASALEEQVRQKDAALHEVDACFEAAMAEGLTDALSDQEAKGIGSLHDLVTRRLMPARDAAVAALSPSTPVEAGETLAGELARALDRMLTNSSRPVSDDYTNAITWAKALDAHDAAERAIAKARAAGLLATPEAKGEAQDA